MYLERYHDIKISPSGIWRILNKLGMSRLPASQRYKDRYKRYEKQLPGQRVQVDVKFIQPIGGLARSTTSSPHRRLHQGPARLPPLRPEDSTQFLDYLLERLPSRSKSSRQTTAPSSKAPSTGTCSTAGSATYIRPATPRLNGKVERSHGSTRRSSTVSSKASSSTTPASSTRSSRNGRTSTTQPTSWRPRWPDPLRATKKQSNHSGH